MKSLAEYIQEKLVIKKNKTPDYKYFPKTKEELREIIEQRIESEGKNVDLNDIDTSKITDMEFMFYNASFNKDISNWDVSNVENMGYMFQSSYFDKDISKWDVSKVKIMDGMFSDSPLENNPPKWYTE